jgi:hypothetical protein
MATSPLLAALVAISELISSEFNTSLLQEQKRNANAKIEVKTLVFIKLVKKFW